MICGTDTLGVGINVPIRTVLFTALCKYDGRRTRLLPAREFHQIAGRAGRAGFDTLGTVVVLAPEHVIENERAVAKAGDDERKRRKVVRKKPPEGSIGWAETTFEKLVGGRTRTADVHFRVTHAMVLGVISRPGDAFGSMRQLLTTTTRTAPPQRRHIRRAIAICRALLRRRGRGAAAKTGRQGRSVRLTVDLQWTSRSTSRSHRWLWPRWTSWTGTHRRIRSTCCRSSRPPWTARVRCCPRSSSRRVARRWPR